MTTSGKLDIKLFHDGGCAEKAEISSSRPSAAKVLLGKTPEQVLASVPLLFAVCNNAQTYAALQACRMALGITADAKADCAREMLVQLESLREHVWRILLDWPHFAGQEVNKKPLAALFTFDAQMKLLLFRDGLAYSLHSQLDINTAKITGLIDEIAALIDSAVFQGGLHDFLQISSEADLLAWLQTNKSLPASLLNQLYGRNWQAVGENPITCLPELDKLSLSQYLQQQDLSAFSLQPNWQGHCFETTVLNRQSQQPLLSDLQSRYHNGLAVRLIARLLEVSRITHQLKQLLLETEQAAHLAPIIATENGTGIGQVQAARGLLVHRLKLAQGRAQDYCIIAPTEWNFHPTGVVVHSLQSLKASDEETLRLQAELLINAIDPCVHYDLNLYHSDKALKTYA